MTVTLTCDTCGDEYETTPHKAERSENNYCSQSCYGKSKGEGKVEVSCDWCGDTFKRYAGNIKGKTFCDTQCHNEWQRSNRGGVDDPAWKGGKKQATCDNCGQTYRDYPSRIDRTDGTYCSRQCSGADKRVEHHATIEQARRSGKWGRVRENVRQRNRRRCQECGHDENLHVHHIEPVSEGGAPFDMDNLVTLCQTCHFHAYHN